MKLLRKQYSPGVFDGSALTLDRDGIDNVGKLLFEDRITNAPYSDIITFDEGIKHDQQVVISEEFNGLLGSQRDACDTTPNPFSVSAYEKTYSPKIIEDRLEECAANIRVDTFWKRWLKPGVSMNDLTGTAWEQYILTRFKKYMSDKMMFQKLFLSNTAISAGGTNVLDASQLKYFNQFNGYFAQLEAIALVDSDRKITITENQGANYAAQAFAAASPTVHPASDYLKQVYFGAPLTVRNASDVMFLVSQSVADQYVQERQAVTNIELAYTRTENGMKQLMYQGIPMIPLPLVDDLINTWFNNSTKRENPHFIIMISKSNLRAGTQSTGSFSDITSDYDKKSKTWFADILFTLDPKIAIDSQVQFAR